MELLPVLIPPRPRNETWEDGACRAELDRLAAVCLLALAGRDYNYLVILVESTLNLSSRS